ncbi:MAG: threonine synthase [Chloroflexi bacterium HGW-Chloroflexi-10]|nr:MAG: threonine synthase [Chloroflexi bacterium HGW-Chloroflexi-10]
MTQTISYLSHLTCPECGIHLNAGEIHGFCASCQSPLVARYSLDDLRLVLDPSQISCRPRGIWRWAELLPVIDPAFRFTLGEGDTPLLPANHLGKRYGIQNLLIKDESFNPTASFKARGLVMAVAKGCELGVKHFIIPTAGNAGSALAAYAARAGVQASVYMPKDAPRPNQAEVEIFGAGLVLVDGLISDAAKAANQARQGNAMFDVSTFKEPYRLEGKKTMGLELAEDFQWSLPDVIIYPTGGGTGLVGMWKAFEELEKLGWIGSQRPRMVSVQSTGCAPIVKAFHAGSQRAEFWENAHTIASGLRVPGAFADRLILQALHQSEGTAVAVTDEQILSAQKEMAEREGIFAAPEGAATLAALPILLDQQFIQPHDRVVLFNTGSGIKYL